MEDLPLVPEQASTVAGQVDALFWYMAILTVLFTVVIAGCIIYFAIKYRRRSEDEVPEQLTGSIKLEVGFMLALLPLALISFFWGAWLYYDMYNPPEDTMEVHVVGKMWMWKFMHPGGQEEINELHVPVGQPIKLTLTSQDVIHAFFVPAFRVKTDVLPGRYMTLWFEATKTGTFHLFCTEYCGTGHSRMVGSIVVQEPAEYQAWLAGSQAQGTQAQGGEELFADLGCAGCHRPDGNGPGPSLVGIFGQEVALEGGETVIADESYIRESILRPNERIVQGYQPIMPTYEGQVNEETLIQLISYIKSIGPQSPATDSGSPQPGAEPIGTPGALATPVPQPGTTEPEN